ncbi:MAG: hypothetical protein ACJ8AO_02550 [Gemmatimonadaceae bacterium]
MSLALLRSRIADVLGTALPAPGAGAPGGGPAALGTGWAALDGALAAGGVPRGRVTEVLGARGSGKTTLVRRLVEATVARGLAVAYVDAARTLAPRDWAPLAADPGAFVAVRPRDPARAPWCADVLLRSGAFALVVLDGGPPLTRAVAARLAHLAREGDAAAVVLADAGVERGAGGAVRLRVQGRAPGGRRRLVVSVEKGGAAPRPVELACAIVTPRRLGRHPEAPDRRGVRRERTW